MILLRTRLLGTCLLAAITCPAAAAEILDARSNEQEYQAKLEQRDWAAAIKSAEALVEAARQEGSTRALTEALSMLGDAQLAAENLIAAEAAFIEALQLAEQERNATPMSETLIEPLRGLGHTLAKAGRHAEAVAVLDRAVRITHRSVGLFDIRQEGMLRELAGSLGQLGRLSEARQHMNYLLQLSERVYGAEDPRRLPIMSAYAEWNAETGDMQTARGTYRAAIELVETAYGKDSPALIEPLRGLARSYMLELYLGPLGVLKPREAPLVGGSQILTEERLLNPRQLPSEGERAVLRAVRIAESADPPRPDLLARALVHAGDWFQIKAQPEKSLSFYRRAWAAAKGQPANPSGDGDEEMLLLAHPVQVYYPTPPLAARHVWRAEEEVEERYVEVQFTVTRHGIVEDEQVIDGSGSRRHASEALQAIRAARYRPRFIDGEPVDTPQMTRREVFRVRK